jgi:hypothetical protein
MADKSRGVTMGVGTSPLMAGAAIVAEGSGRSQAVNCKNSSNPANSILNLGFWWSLGQFIGANFNPTVAFRERFGATLRVTFIKYSYSFANTAVRLQ